MAPPASPSSKASPTAKALVAWPSIRVCTASALMRSCPWLSAWSASFCNSMLRRALSLPMASTRAETASASMLRLRSAAVRSTSWRWPAPSQIAGSWNFCSLASPCFTRFCRAFVVRKRPSGLAGLVSTSWVLSGMSSSAASKRSASSLGQALQKGERCSNTTRIPAPKGGVRASSKACWAWPASLPSRRLRLMLLQLGSIASSIRVATARSRAALSSPQSRWIGMEKRRELGAALRR